MNQKTAKKLLKKTRKDYTKIADHFAETRKYIWPEFKKFLAYLKSGDKVLDVGCGNGRLLQLFYDMPIDYIGIDSCPELIEQAKKKWHRPNRKIQFTVADAVDLDFEEGSFDAVFCLATLHHIPGKEMQEKVIANIKRVVKKNGYVFITVWNLWQKKYRGYIWKNNFKKIIFLSKFDFNDFLLPWKNPDGKIMATRYCHAFKKEELESLLVSSGLKIIQSGFSGRHEKKFYIIIVAQK